MKSRGITPEIAQKIRAASGKKETNLQRIRVQRGLSQQALAELSGVTKRAIEVYEQRHRDIDGAKIQTLCDLCLALDCGIEDILENEQAIEKYRKVKQNSKSGE